MLTRKQLVFPLKSETTTPLDIERPKSKESIEAGAPKTIRKEASGSVKTLRKPAGAAPRTEREPAKEMKLSLVNNNLNLRLEISSGDIVGRTEGRFSKVLSSFSKISRQHARFDYDKSEQCWFVTDLGSTNGTKMRVSGYEITTIEQNRKIKLMHDSYLYIGTIEMRISII